MEIMEMIEQDAVEFKNEIMAQYREDSEQLFKRELRVKGFNDEDIKNIIEVVDRQPMFLIGIDHISLESKNGVVVAYSNKPRKVRVFPNTLPEVDPDKIERYSSNSFRPLIFLVLNVILILAAILWITKYIKW